jgi:hypothetical protein
MSPPRVPYRQQGPGSVELEKGVTVEAALQLEPQGPWSSLHEKANASDRPCVEQKMLDTVCLLKLHALHGGSCCRRCKIGRQSSP